MKLGIVFEGGASRAFFSCGVMDALLEEHIIADYVIGASAGIANGVSYVSGQYGRNLAIGTKYTADKRYMGVRHLFDKSNRSFYNLQFVFDDIPNKYLPFDFDAFAAFEGDVLAVCTNMNTGKAEYIRVPPDDRAFTVLRATCALPVLFQPIEIDGYKYLDGGLSDPIPFEKAIQQLYNAQREKLFELERKKRVFVIDPIETAGFKRTERDPTKIREIYDQGVERTKSKMSALREYIGR